MHFHVVVMQKRTKKCTKKRDAQLLITFSLPSASLDPPYIDHGLSGSCTKEMHVDRKLSV